MRASASPPQTSVEHDAEAARSLHLQRALQYSLVMPSTQFFTHVTAALLWDFPLSAQLLFESVDLDVGEFAPRRHPRAAGVKGHQIAARHATSRVHPKLGVRLASPASTWAMMAAVMPDVRELVAVGDAAVREPMFRKSPPQLATLAQLEAVIATGRRVGIGGLRAALPLIRTRSASRPETLCRLLLKDAGLPEPELNWEVWASGLLVACIDLAYPQLKIAIEYEGEHHLLNSAQWSKDIARHERLTAMGWIIVRVTKEQLFGDPAGVVARVVRAIRSRG